MRVVSGTLILWLWQNAVAGNLSQFYTLDLESSQSCLLISKYKIWPFAGLQRTTKANFAGVATNAKRICNELGTSPAILENPGENLALQRWKSCTDTLPANMDRILLGQHNLIGYAIGEKGHKCYYHNFINETLAHSDSADCVEQFLPPSGSTTGPVHFVCKKYASCDRLDCIPNPKRPEKCYRLLEAPKKGFFDHFEAETLCDLHGGSLLVLDSMEDFRFIKNEFGSYQKYWLAMKGELEQKNFLLKECKRWTGGLKNCFDNYKKFYWDITWNQTRIDITKQNYPNGFDVEFRTKNPQKDEEPENCFIIDFQDNKKMIKTRSCSIGKDANYPPATLCEFSTKRKKQLQSDNRGSKLSCENPPTPPSQTRLVLEPNTKPVCAYESVSYKCNAGGVNKFRHDMNKDTIDVLCNGDTFQYVLPEEWPQCTSNAVCKPPHVHSGVMQVQRTLNNEYIEENDKVGVNCVHQKKRLVKKSDWKAGNASTDQLLDSITLTCLNSTGYDVDLSEYICTPACIRPYNTTELYPDWSNTVSPPEMGDTVKYRCNGSQIVSKADFEVGTDRSALKDDVSVTCTFTGKYEPDFLDFTCAVKECGIPTNYSQVMNYDYIEGSSTTTLGTIINYECLDPTQVIAHSANEDFLANTVRVECLFNGQWSYNIQEFGCTQCQRPMKPLNGKFDCETFNFTEQSSCFLRCDSGFVPEGPTKMTCKYGKKTYRPNAGTLMYFWDFNTELFKCVKPISMVIGGIGTNHQYLKDIELFAPERKCSGTTLKAFPRATVGMVGAFVSGYAIVCGGAANTYVDCERNKFSKTCQRNVECITTAGDAQWCSGPKMKDCFVYNPFITETFEPIFKLKTERAFAASVVLPDGTLWILGGAGRHSVLDTTEYVMYDYNRRSWKVKAGPKLPVALMGHCAALIGIDEVLVNGGYGIFHNDTDDYSANTYVYNLKTGEWKGRNWMRSKLGPKMDHVCIPYKDMIVSVGGWNNKLINQTEIYLENTWSIIENKTSLAVRSATTIQLNTKPYFLGGVTCLGLENERKICTKVADIYEFSDDTNEWSLTDTQMTVPRSSHLAIHAPVTYFPSCTP